MRIVAAVRRTGWRRLGAPLFCLVLLGMFGACAQPKRPIRAPGPVASPKFPDFVYPAAPAALGPAAARGEHEAGWQWLQSGDLRNAERAFGSVLKQAPQFYPAEAGLGLVALARKDPAEATTHFKRALAADAAYAPALAGRGDALLTLGEREQALASFEAAVASDPALTDLRGRIDVLRFRGMQDAVTAARKAAEAGQLAEARRIYERSIEASPDSAFLYRELAAVERRDGSLEAALRHAEKAAELSPAEPRAFITLGEVYEAQGAFAKAAEAYGTAVALEPSETLDARIDALREKAAFAAMPEEYRAIETAPTVTRAQLAALFGVRLDDLLKRARRENAAVMTDTRGNWAGPWILSVSRAGIMEAYPNHTFQPGAAVRRGDLAAAVSRTLALVAAERPREGERWKGARVKLSDVAPGHLSYPAVSMAVQAGVMRPTAEGAFQLTRPVTGAEALDAIRKLEELSGRTPR